MADQSDVENVLVTTVAQAMYPYGIGSPSVLDAACKIYRGWPSRNNLDADLKEKKINITVIPTDNERNTTRYLLEFKQPASPPAALQIATAATTITLTGTPKTPLNVAALVNGKGFVYPVQRGNSLNDIASGLATLINAFIPASSSGAVITVSGAHSLQARVGEVKKIVQEIKRQQRSFRVILWCADPATRDAVAQIVDPALSQLSFINLPDGMTGRVRYEKSATLDNQQKENLYRRDLIYSVEYATTVGDNAAEIVAHIMNIAGSVDTTAAANTYTI